MNALPVSPTLLVEKTTVLKDTDVAPSPDTSSGKSFHELFVSTRSASSQSKTNALEIDDPVSPDATSPHSDDKSRNERGRFRDRKSAENEHHETKLDSSNPTSTAASLLAAIPSDLELPPSTTPGERTPQHSTDAEVPTPIASTPGVDTQTMRSTAELDRLNDATPVRVALDGESKVATPSLHPTTAAPNVGASQRDLAPAVLHDSPRSMTQPATTTSHAQNSNVVDHVSSSPQQMPAADIASKAARQHPSSTLNVAPSRPVVNVLPQHAGVTTKKQIATPTTPANDPATPSSPVALVGTGAVGTLRMPLRTAVGVTQDGAALPGVASQLTTVLSSLRPTNSGGHTVTIALHPDGLGSVRATVTAAPNELLIRLSASTAAGESAIRNALPELHSGLANNELPTTVVLSPSTSYTPSDTSGQQQDNTFVPPPTNTMNNFRPSTSSLVDSTDIQAATRDSSSHLDVRV